MKQDTHRNIGRNSFIIVFLSSAKKQYLKENIYLITENCDTKIIGRGETQIQFCLGWAWQMTQFQFSLGWGWQIT